MREFLSLSHLSSTLWVSLLVLSAHVLWAQGAPALEESAVQLPDAPSWVATVLPAQTHLHLTYRGLPLSFKQAQTESWMRFFSDRTGYDHLSVNTNAVLNQHAGTAGFWGRNKYFIGSAPAKWTTFAPTFGQLHYEAIPGANNLEYYGHHIPWAGSVILRIGQQAKAHPHLTRALKTLHPRF